MTKYEIIHEDEKSISIRCIQQNEENCTIHRLKQPARNFIEAEADDIVRCARKQGEGGSL